MARLMELPACTGACDSNSSYALFISQVSVLALACWATVDREREVQVLLLDGKRDTMVVVVVVESPVNIDHVKLITRSGATWCASDTYMEKPSAILLLLAGMKRDRYSSLDASPDFHRLDFHHSTFHTPRLRYCLRFTRVHMAGILFQV